MNAIQEMITRISLTKSRRYAGISRTMWYYAKKPRDVKIDSDTLSTVRKIASKRPTYGTRRMAAQITRETGNPINRKKIQRIYRKIGWIVPKMSKSDIQNHKAAKLFKPSGPNQLWQTDITYIHCGVDGWCYCFNVLDAFTRKWLSYTFEVSATAKAAVAAVVHAVAQEQPDTAKLRIRTDNGSQYSSREFRESIKSLGIRHDFIWKNTPEQNGHIESFHKTLKKEYVWPKDFARFQDAEEALAHAYADYNSNRIHSALEYLTPNEFIRKLGSRSIK